MRVSLYLSSGVTDQSQYHRDCYYQSSKFLCLYDDLILRNVYCIRPSALYALKFQKISPAWSVSMHPKAPPRLNISLILRHVRICNKISTYVSMHLTFQRETFHIKKKKLISKVQIIKTMKAFKHFKYEVIRKYTTNYTISNNMEQKGFINRQ